MKYLVFVGALLFASPLWAQQAGPSIVTAADVTATTSATLIVAASTPSGGGSTPKRICEYLTNSGANPARCGDASVGVAQGLYLASSGGSIVLCVASAVYCVGVGGSTTINNAETDR